MLAVFDVVNPAPGRGLLFDFVQQLDMAQGLLGERALFVACSSKNLRRVWAMQPDLGHAEFKAGLVTAKIIADQLAPPVLQEVASMLTGTAGTKAITTAAKSENWLVA